MSWDVVKSQGVFRVLGLAGRSCEEPARIDIDSMTSEMLVIHRCCSDDELRPVRTAVYCGFVQTAFDGVFSGVILTCAILL